MVRVQSLTVDFHHTQALKQVSFCLQNQSRTVLLGANGSGKSTLMRSLAGLQRPTQGRIDTQNQRLALLGQSLGFPKGLKVGEVLQLVLSLAQRPRDRDWLIHCCHLQALLATPTQQLSGGQHRRLAIALSLADHCDLLLLDEPSQALDHDSRQRLWQGLASLDCAMLLCTHDLEEAQALAEQLLILDQGQLVYFGEKTAFLAQLQGYLVQAQTQLTDFPWPVSLTQGQLSYFCQQPEPVVRWLLDQDEQLSQLLVREISLQEAVTQFRQGVAA